MDSSGDEIQRDGIIRRQRSEAFGDALQVKDLGFVLDGFLTLGAHYLLYPLGRRWPFSNCIVVMWMYLKQIHCVEQRIGDVRSVGGSFNQPLGCDRRG